MCQAYIERVYIGHDGQFEDGREGMFTELKILNIVGLCEILATL